MNTRIATIAAGLVAAALAAPGLAPAVAGAAPGNAACHVEANNPHHSKGSPGWIVGKGRISCTAAIDSVKVIVRLERKENGKWVAVGNTGTNDQVAPKANEKYTAQGEFRCEPGEYRTAAQGSGVYGGRPSGSMAWQYSGTVTNPCG